MHEDAMTSARSSGNVNPAGQVLEMLTTFYGAMGNPPEAKGALVLMAEALAARADPQAINLALDRCMTECRFPVRLPDIFRRIPGSEAADVNAAKRAAWDVVETFVSKYLRWNSERTIARVERGSPELSPRILDTIRRSGGWSVYLRMTDEDFPHQQKRFFEEYEAWVEVQAVAADPARVLEMPKLKELAAAMSIERPAPSVRNFAQATTPVSPQKARILKAIANAGKPRRL